MVQYRQEAKRLTKKKRIYELSKVDFLDGKR